MGFGGADLYTAPAKNAPVNIQDNAVFGRRKCISGAMLNALRAPNATLFVLDMLLGDRQSFRIMAPPACKGATLEEYGGSNPGTIMNGILFYIKYDTFGHSACTR
jgi:hypothetical protein